MDVLSDYLWFLDGHPVTICVAGETLDLDEAKAFMFDRIM